MNCTHIPRLHSPKAAVHKEECTQCFDSVDDACGIDVCLVCFNAGCVAEDRNHAHLHHRRSGHPIALNIRRTPKLREEPKRKQTKLQVEEEKEEFDVATFVRCYVCNDRIQTNEEVERTVEQVLKAVSSSKASEVRAWSQEIIPCEHTLQLVQEEGDKAVLAQCSACELKENLWLCLQCGNLGCGRKQFGGGGGNGHGLVHFDSTQHPVAVKLGSITPEGDADAYCYLCNDERQDPKVAEHLAHFGVDILAREKTEKSLVEMQLAHNLTWQFSMTTDDGKEMIPLFGPGFTGIRNLGNSCYLASTLQCLFSTQAFFQRYFLQEDPPAVADPAQDLETQMRKMADGLLSGRYSQPTDRQEGDQVQKVQKGLSPSMFKSLVGKGHEEFSTMRQQDANEFCLHLFKLISRSPQAVDPTAPFRFRMEERLQCLGCRRVKYQTQELDNLSIPVPAMQKDIGEGHVVYEPVTLEQCLESFTSDEIITFTCPSCHTSQNATKSILFKSFPDLLMINARRFGLVNWVPTKLEIPLIVSGEVTFFERFRSQGLQPGEEVLEGDAGPTGDPAIVEQLEAMGFPRARCEQAAVATQNTDAEAAMNWLLSHMDDPEPTPSSAEPSAEQVETLVAMGFAHGHAARGLRECGGDPERAVEWLFSHPDHTQPAGEAPVSAGREDVPGNFRLQSMMCHKGVCPMPTIANQDIHSRGPLGCVCEERRRLGPLQ